MRVYVFGTSVVGLGREKRERIERVLMRLADGTPTDDLVTSVYLRRGNDWYAHTTVEWLPRGRFARAGGRWAFVREHPLPPDLPERFKLIRIAVGNRISYPGTMLDRYGWEIRCRTFDDHLAYVFAHELHHFRRYHLDLHPREGEQASCRWALRRASDAGFAAEGSRVTEPGRRRRRKKVRLPDGRHPGLIEGIKGAASRLCLDDLRELARWTRSRIQAAGHQRGKWDDHFDALRVLPSGTSLLVVGDDDRQRYLGQTVVKIRNLRQDSVRLAVRTSDGKEWHWPMRWLSAVPPAEASRDLEEP